MYFYSEILFWKFKTQNLLSPIFRESMVQATSAGSAQTFACALATTGDGEGGERKKKFSPSLTVRLVWE